MAVRLLLVLLLVGLASGCPETADVYPALPEICNDEDDDNDGVTDESPAQHDCPPIRTNQDTADRACESGRCFIECRGSRVDLDDDPANGCECQPVPETCDGVDNDCDGETDEGLIGDLVDPDGVCSEVREICRGREGWAEPDLDRVPGYEPDDERTCDGLDNDCDGRPDEDFGIGGACTVGVGACAVEGRPVCTETGDSAVCAATPGEPGVETCNGIDDDCNGVVDSDAFPALGTGCEVAPNSPCAAAGVRVCATESEQPSDDPVVCNARPRLDRRQPGPDACDGVDNDCDGIVDEDAADADDTCDSGRPGICSAGYRVCTDDLGPWQARCIPHIDPERQQLAESCDGRDDDCDGRTDEEPNLLCQGAVVSGNGIGRCEEGRCRAVCSDGHQDRDGLVVNGCECRPPSGEIANNLDDDCDGRIDEGNGTPEVCNGIDDDADGRPDEGNGEPEVCDGRDNDADCWIDEGFDDANGCWPRSACIAEPVEVAHGNGGVLVGRPFLAGDQAQLDVFTVHEYRPAGAATLSYHAMTRDEGLAVNVFFGRVGSRVVLDSCRLTMGTLGSASSTAISVTRAEYLLGNNSVALDAQPFERADGAVESAFLLQAMSYVPENDPDLGFDLRLDPPPEMTVALRSASSLDSEVFGQGYHFRFATDALAITTCNLRARPDQRDTCLLNTVSLGDGRWVASLARPLAAVHRYETGPNNQQEQGLQQLGYRLDCNGADTAWTCTLDVSEGQGADADGAVVEAKALMIWRKVRH